MSKGDGPDETVSEVSAQPDEQNLTSEEANNASDFVLTTKSTDIDLDKNISVIDPEPYIKHRLHNK